MKNEPTEFSVFCSDEFIVAAWVICTGFSRNFIYLYRARSTQHPGHYTTNYTAIRASKGDTQPTSSPPAFLSHCEGAHQLQNLKTALKTRNTSVPFTHERHKHLGDFCNHLSCRWETSENPWLFITFDKDSLRHY
jgi:hypothetical protein